MVKLNNKEVTDREGKIKFSVLKVALHPKGEALLVCLRHYIWHLVGRRGCGYLVLRDTRTHFLLSLHRYTQLEVRPSPQPAH